MSVRECENCEVLLDLRWEARYRKSMHVRAMQRESTLREKVRELEKRVVLRVAKINDLEEQNEALKAKLSLMQQQLFGRKSEQTKPSLKDGGRSQVNSDGARSADASSDSQRRRGKQPGARGHGRKPHAHLPAEEISHDLPEDAKCCPQCGKPFDSFPGTEDSQEIHWEV